MKLLPIPSQCGTLDLRDVAIRQSSVTVITLRHTSGKGAMPSDPDIGFLGFALRWARLKAGIKSQDEMGKELGYDRTAIAKAEAGKPLSSGLAAAYAKRFPELLGTLFEEGLIEEWAAHVKRSNGRSFPKDFGKFADVEKDAATLFYWASNLIPGLFQTEKYAHTILGTEPDDESLETRLEDRMDRQHVLTRPNPPVVVVVLAEAVLHRWVGGPEVMYEQLMHLVEVIDQQPNVMIQVIPGSVAAHAGLGGAASIASTEDGTVVHLDSFTAGQTKGEPELVTRVRLLTDMLRYEALPRTGSRELILKVAEECKAKI